MRRRTLAALTGAMMLSACVMPTAQIGTTAAGTASAGPTGPGATPWAVISSGPATGGAPRAAIPTGVTVSGAVKVPAGLVAAGGMNLVAAGSGNIVAAGGMNYALLALQEEAAGGVEVFLADAAGNPIPGLATAKTDAAGAFEIENVPADFTFVVACQVPTKDGKTATFQTLAKPGKLGATANLDAATTLVAANVLEGQKGGDLGDFNPAVFKTATETTAKNLAPEKLPDFSDRASVKAKMAELIEAVAELKVSVDQLRTEIAEVKKTLEDLKAELAKAQAPAGEAPPAGTDGTRPDPTQTPQAPPPTGTAPAPGGACAPSSHRFLVENREAIAYIEFKVPTPDKPRDQWMTASTAKRDADYWANTPDGCPHLVLAKNESGQVVGMIENFTIPTGAPKDVKLDFRPATSTGSSPAPTTSPTTGATKPPSTAPTTGPGGTVAQCTEKRLHRFKTRSTDVAFLLFDVPNSGDPPQHAAQGQLGADGLWEASVPEGCPHDIKGFDRNWQFIGGMKGHVIPIGAPEVYELAF